MGYEPGEVLAFVVGGERICTRVGDPLTIGEARYVPIEGLDWPGLARVLVPLDGSVSLWAPPPADSLPIAIEGLTPPSELTWVRSLVYAFNPPALHDGWFAVGEADSSPRYLVHRWCSACMDTGTTVVLGRRMGILWVEWTTFSGPERMVPARLEICTGPEDADRRRDARIRVDTMTGIGGVHQRAGRPDSALVYYERALLEVDRSGEGRTDNLFSRIMGLEAPADSESKLRFQHKVLQVFRRFEYRAFGSRSGELTILVRLGLTHEALGQPDSAFAYYQSGLAVAREDENHSDERFMLQTIGNLHLEVGRPDSAISYYKQVLASYQRHPTHAPWWRHALEIHVRIGDLYCDLGHADLADAHYEEAIAIREKDVAWKGPTGREEGCTEAPRQ